jgi:hypothetical protein
VIDGVVVGVYEGDIDGVIVGVYEGCEVTKLALFQLDP